MFAAVYQPGNERTVLERNYPIRELEDNQILIKVAACGVCHSDVEILTGVTLDTRTYAMGHESSGYPVKLGSKVDSNAVRIGELYSILSFDSCTHGVKGGPALSNGLGIGRDGAYAEYVIVTADLLVPVPKNVSPEVAAIATDAGVTTYHAVKYAAEVKQGDKVLIFGIGGLGHLALQYAKHFGATVYACDFKPEARKLALELGAVEAFDLIEMTNKTTAGFTVDTTIDFVASSQTFTLAMAALRGNDVNYPSKPKCVMASLVCLHVGVSAENLVFNTLDILTVGAQILGSTFGDRNDLVAVLDLFAKGAIRAEIHTEPLENINRVIDELRAFRVTGRKVVIPHSAK
ncbi:chaperonin 10-like protein [Mycena sanguinolenta]|nr:chaperonin 10-like protein [Mycena sanguinolenta]